MSSVPAFESTSPPHDAAEKGAAEVLVVPANVTALDEKRVDSSVVLATVTEVVQVPPNKKSVDKPPAKEVSKWILWALWFNTYRFVFFVSIMSIGPNSNSYSLVSYLPSFSP
jgi:hypothetical protein